MISGSQLFENELQNIKIMKKTYLIFLLAFLPLMTIAQIKRTINVETAGTLPTLISDEEKFTISALTLSGPLNGTDFRLLREMAGCGYDGRATQGRLKSLDLTNARIVADAEDSEGYFNAKQVINDSGNYGVVRDQNLPLRTKDDVFGDCLFAGCDQLIDIKLPSGIKEMGHDLFTLAGRSLDIIIPKEVSFIDLSAFNGHPYPVNSINVEEGNQTYSSPNNCNAIVQGTTLLVASKTTVIPDGITTIGGGAFNYGRGCPPLPESVTRIEAGAFWWSYANSVTLPKNLQYIGDGAFGTFQDEPDLKTVISEIVDPSAVTLGENVFGKSGGGGNPVDVLYVPSGTKAAYEAIPEWKNSFTTIIEKEEKRKTIHVETAGTLSTLISDAEKYTIEELTLTGNLNGIDLRLIRDMAGSDYNGVPTDGVLNTLDLSGVTIVDGESYVELVDGRVYFDKEKQRSSGGFDNAPQTSVANTFGKYLFVGCHLSTLIFPNNLKAIGERSLENTGLSKVTLPVNSLETIGSRAFHGVGLQSFTLPRFVTSVASDFIRSSSLKELKVEDGNTKYDSRNNCNAIIESESNCLIVGCSATTIPNSVTAIGSSAFNNCNNLTSMIIPEGVTSIGMNAFVGCGLTKVIIPNSITSIGLRAFLGCRNLRDVYCYSENVPTTDSRAFDDSNVGSAILHVPAGSIDTYKATAPWNGFKDVVAVVETDTKEEIKDVEVNGIRYNLRIAFDGSGTAEVISHPNIYSGDVVIPETIVYKDATCNVTSIGDQAFSGCSKLLFITIPNTVTSIGYRAFCNCGSLSSITIPNSVTSIENDAFFGCGSLTSIVIPQSVTHIGTGILSNCWSITSIKVESGNTKYDSRNGCNAIIDISTNELVAGCQNTVIPNDVTSIRGYAFKGCYITSASIPSTVTSIGDYAFQNCNSLSSVIIPNSVTAIGELAFSYCYNLNYLVIGSGVQSIGRMAFASNQQLKKVVCKAESVPSSDNTIFDITPISSITLSVPSGSVDAYKAVAPWGNFMEITGITVSADNIVFEDDLVKTLCVLNWDTGSDEELSYEEAAAVTDFGKVFYSKRIKTFNEMQYFTGITTIGESAFCYCNDLGEVTLPEGMTTIEVGAFAWSGLTSIKMPSTLTTIENDAFAGCYNLTSFTLPKSVTQYGTGLGALKDCRNLISIKVEDGNPKYDSRENCNAIIETSTNTLISGCQKTTIPTSVTILGRQPFRGIPLANFVMPSWITSIGERAFWDSALSSVTIPSSVTSIGEFAFSYCYGLSTVIVESPTPIAISENTFTGRTNIDLIVSAGSISSYMAADYWKDFNIKKELKDQFSSTDMWAGYVADEDLSLTEGLTAYTISAVSNTTATATSLDYIPKDVPVLLKRSDTSVNSFLLSSGTGTAPSTNLLEVYATDKTVSNREGYVLYKDEFVLVNAGTLPAGRIFLPLNGGNAAATRGIVIEGEGTTGIRNLVSDSEASHGEWYDLQGRKLDGKPIRKGVYILNGRKVVVK